MSMTKSQLVSHLSETLDVTKASASRFLEALAEVATEELKSSCEFAIPGIGKLKLVHKPARVGTRPTDGSSIDIPAKNVIKASFGKAIKDAVN